MTILVIATQKYFVLSSQISKLRSLIASMAFTAPKPIIRFDLFPTKNSKLLQYGFVHIGLFPN